MPQLLLVCMQDAAVFVKREGNGQYDVIIVDSSDPVRTQTHIHSHYSCLSNLLFSLVSM
jgi:spermidine synthase